ncbi:SDR family NAD(P)-dependent oxidoreductase [Desertimonas flava]|jgi:NAD(P)-dependent dehydrogenase (short-subunit alcohol dehydrogenase family)|uniref:SDR family NAD(P)-dependent oxidoreductase n=1 Tax=Desertimonas flava TaxID=2064846 RepID=UPI000E343299|nr:glucose 1-dehydrogenase [Desertimonas flava]
MDLGLQGKVVVIAGGAAGIGRECAEAFAAEGARLAIFDWDADALAETASAIGATGAEVHTERVDVSDARSVDAAHARVIESLGGIDVGFNNAAIITPSKAIEDTSEDDWDRVVGVNLKGVWLCVRAQVRHMRPRGAGAIVNMASAAALVGAPGTTPYTAAKHGVLGITRTVALELATTGVRVNAVAPGTVDTKLNTQLFAGEDPFADALVRQGQPIGRNAHTSEIADAVLWLASERSTFVLGSTLVIDGGFTAQ